MKFKPSHNAGFMLTSANAEDDGYFELKNHATTDTVAVQITRRANGRMDKVRWYRKLPTSKRYVEVTGNAVARALEGWRRA